MYLNTLLRYAKGALSLGDSLPDMAKKGWVEAFQHKWPDDRHFVCYAIGQMSIPRLTKSLGHNETIMGHFIALDYDRVDEDGNKDPWKEGEAQEWLESVQSQLTGIYANWAVLHTTKNGGRILYRLNKGLQVLQFEAAVKWFAYNCPIDVDKATVDWTRIFRFYDVVRNGVRTGTAHYAGMLINEERTLNVDDLDLEEYLNHRTSSTAVFRSPKPTAAQCDAIVFAPDSEELSQFFRTVERKLVALVRDDKDDDNLMGMVEGAECPDFGKGSRNEGIHRVVGKLARLLRKLPDIGPEHVYALLVEAVAKMPGDRDTHDWTDELWRSCESVWATEEHERDEAASIAVVENALFKDDLKKQEQEEVEAQEFLTNIRKWSGHTGTDLEVADWIYDRSILMKGSNLFVILRNGFYDKHPIDRRGLIAHIRHNKLEAIIPTTYESIDGKEKQRSVTTIINEQAVNIGQVSGRAGLEGTVIRDPLNVTGAVDIEVPMARLRTDVKSKFHKVIDKWLRLLVGDHYEYVQYWIAKALDITAGFVPALYLQGPSSAGKSMIVAGLTACLVGRPKTVTDRMMFAHNNDEMGQSCFIHINENWSVNKSGNLPADEIRRLIGSSDVSINTKYGVKYSGHCNYRFILTDNDGELMEGLSHAKGLRKQSRIALLRRISHIVTSSAASRFLAKHGGYELTERWARSGDMLAEHFMYLHQQFATKRFTGIEGLEDDGRFLIPAVPSPILADNLQDSEELTQIGEIICRGLERSGNHSGRGFVVSEGEAYVLSEPILEQLREDHSRIKTNKDVTRYLREVHGSAGKCRRRFNGPPRQWHHISKDFLRRILDSMDSEIEGLDLES